jgi:hypothetical protein
LTWEHDRENPGERSGFLNKDKYKMFLLRRFHDQKSHFIAAAVNYSTIPSIRWMGE